MEGDRYHILFVEQDTQWAGRIADVFAHSTVCPATVDVVADAPRALQAVHLKRYDAVLLDTSSTGDRGLEVVEAFRTAGVSSAVIVLSADGAEATAMEAMALGADDFLDKSEGRSPSLPRNTRHAIDRRQLAQEKARLEFQDRRRLIKEKEEADKLIRQQRHIIRELEQHQQKDLAPGGSGAARQTQDDAGLEDVLTRYRGLLRAYVVMGNDSLSEDMGEFAAGLVVDEVGPADLLQVHLHVIEQMTASLGVRSARHVVTRAGTLILDLMVRLAQLYRTRRSAWLTPPLEVALVSRDSETADATQAAFSSGKLRSSLTVVEDAAELVDLLSQADPSQETPCPDLILWDADTLCNEDVEPIGHLQEQPWAADVPQVLITSPGSLPLVPMDFQPMFGTLTKPIETKDVLGLIASLPHFWLNVCKLDPQA